MTRDIGRRRLWQWLWSRSLRLLGDAHRHFGNLYGSRREYEAAVANYTRAVALDPAYAQAYYCRGVLYWRELGQPARAVADLSRVLELDPARSLAYFNRALAYQTQHDTARAVADFERYLAEGTDAFWREAARRQLALYARSHAERGNEKISQRVRMSKEVQREGGLF